MTALWVIPSIDRSWRAECLGGLRAQRTLVVDNAPPNENLGVTLPWNLGRRAAEAVRADYLVVCSEAVRFGPAGGLDLEAELTGDPLVLTMCAGFHLVAFHLDALAVVGDFDENLPTYGSDRDVLIRLGLAGLPAPGYNDLPVRQLAVDVTEAGVAHSLTEGLARVSFARMTRYLAEKWGGVGPGEHHAHPFGDPANDWTYWPRSAGAGPRSSDVNPVPWGT